MYQNRMNKTWTFLNNYGIHHFTTYNKDNVHPLIISDWTCIVQYYNLHDNVVVEVGYYGDNIFEIKDYKTISSQ